MLLAAVRLLRIHLGNQLSGWGRNGWSIARGGSGVADGVPGTALASRLGQPGNKKNFYRNRGRLRKRKIKHDKREI
ncbi:hypothetical protein [Ottowia sp.]|uniref:hypothetical protein n=1 Tax=Ottowia sp. TaxID=1898956 RepID=UPI002C17E4BF|nr:hypothetical protein [Ottowia sp.]HOB66029.1 hypothetical protein [Ottowia sp.]HPZ56071.1 hypothetical protein [Ottowia sp.]HQD48620.1 hypothetical protein [Ottowia sp.]